MTTATGNPKGKEEHAGKEPLEKAKEVGAQAVDKAKEVGAHAADKAKEAVSSVGGMASQAACAVGKKADDMTASAGADIKKWGDTMAHAAPHEGVLGHASQAVAATLKEGGQYIEDAKFSGMAEDLNKMIRRNPMPALLVGVGVGFILGRAMRS